MIPRILLIAALGFSTLHGADPAPEDLLRQGLFEEEANHDLDKAAERYRAVIAAHDRQRALAASATFRLGEIARKKNDKDAAAAAFHTVADRFPEQTELARLSRENLAALGIAAPAAATAETPSIPQAADPEETEIARLKDIARNSPDLIDGADPSGWRPMHLAAKNGWTEVIAYLLENKADPNSRTTTEQITPLHTAAIYGQLGAVKALLAAKADIQETLIMENYPSGNPTRDNRAEQIKGAATALDLAIIFDRREVARTLIAAGANLKTTGPMMGSGFGMGVADSFLRPSDQGDTHAPLTSLHLAIFLHRNEIALELIKAGAPLTTPDTRDAPAPLQFSILFSSELVEPLLKAKANPMLGFPSFQVSPLHEASNKGLVQIAKLLIDAGADVKATDAAGKTPLHYAVSAEMVELLVSKGADVNAKDLSGLTPLESIVSREEDSVPKAMEALLQHGATVADAKALLQRTTPATLPLVRERLAYPKEQRPDRILLSLGGSWSMVGIDAHERGFLTVMEERPAPGSPAPTLAEGMWPYLYNEGGSIVSSTCFPGIRILRRKPDEKFLNVLEWTANEKAPALKEWPTLEWGDIVELNSSSNSVVGALYPSEYSFGKLAPRKVLVRLESWTYTMDMSDEKNRWLRVQLGNIPRDVAEFVDRVHLSVIRKGVEKPISVDLSQQKHPGFRLIDGDVIDLNFSDTYWNRVYKTSVNTINQLLETEQYEVATLIPILAKSDARCLADWRHVRVFRRDGDKPSKNVDLVAWAKSLPPREKWNREELAAADLKLNPGEVVMIPPFRDGTEDEKKTDSETSEKIRQVAEFLNGK